MVRLGPVLLVIAAGCGPPDPLAETPVDGGTPEVRAAIRAELVAFDEATGGGRTRVSRVRVRDIDGVGRLDRLTNTITVDEGLDPRGAAFALRHELCHALDDVDGPLGEEHEALYDRLAGGLFAPGAWMVGEAPRGDARRRREAVAAFCALGPVPAQILRQPCPNDADGDVAQAMGHLWERVWTGASWMPVAGEGPAWASIAVAPGASDVRALGADAGAVWVAWREGDVERDGVYDLRTGVGVDGAAPLAAPDALQQIPGGLPDAPAVRVEAVGWIDGPAAAQLTVPLYHLPSAERLVVSDGESWAVLGDGCVDAPPFAAGGRVFTLRVGEDRVGWGPVP